MLIALWMVSVQFARFFSYMKYDFSIANSAVGNDDFELWTGADMKEQHVP